MSAVRGKSQKCPPPVTHHARVHGASLVSSTKHPGGDGLHIKVTLTLRQTDDPYFSLLEFEGHYGESEREKEREKERAKERKREREREKERERKREREREGERKREKESLVKYHFVQS